MVGLSFQRPDKRGVEQNPEAVRVWREETWPVIRAKAKAEGGEVIFAGQVGIRSDQVTGRTWGAKGRTPIVRRSGNRFSVNAMSAISTKGWMHFMVFTETFDADVMCRFLDRLAGHFDRKVHLVVDGHSAHRSRKVRAWLPDHPDRPDRAALSASYSPEPNPDELVNADLKRSLPMHSRARDQVQRQSGVSRPGPKTQPLTVTELRGCSEPGSSGHIWRSAGRSAAGRTVPGGVAPGGRAADAGHPAGRRCGMDSSEYDEYEAIVRVRKGARFARSRKTECAHRGMTRDPDTNQVGQAEIFLKENEPDPVAAYPQGLLDSDRHESEARA